MDFRTPEDRKIIDGIIKSVQNKHPGKSVAELRDEISERLRPYNLDIWIRSDGKPYVAKANFCFFCKHCTDIYWDYTNGPYMCCCDIVERRLANDVNGFNPKGDPDEKIDYVLVALDYEECQGKHFIRDYKED